MNHLLCSVLLIVLLNCCLIGKAQNEKGNTSDTTLKSFLKFKLSFESGLAWEQRIGKFSSLEILAGIGIGGQTDNFFDFKAHTIILPITKLEYRSYYNFKKRVEKYNNTKNNSANFLFGAIETSYAIKNQNYFGLFMSEGWGLQRSINKKLGVDIHLGIVEHFYYDRPPYGGFNYLKIEPDVSTSIFYAF